MTSTTLLQILSRLLGWIYTLSWSLSFYPQPWLNYIRHTTAGTTPAFPVLNVVGFACLTIQSTLFYCSPLIRSQYRVRNNGQENTTQFNDLLFAIHGLVLCCVTFSQFWPRLWGFERRSWRVSRFIWGIVWGCFTGVTFAVLMVVWKSRGGERDIKSWAWIDVAYAFGAVKLLVTLVKYIPQVWTNYKRQSTVGWSINQILMDFVGGILSIAQLVIDSSLQSDWSGITGNPVKFGLGQISICFDVVFMMQHYVMYKGAGTVLQDDIERVRTSGDSGERLLASDEEEERAW